MNNILAISFGAIFGALLRYGIFTYFENKHFSFPYHTLVVNIVGCFLIGIISEYITIKQDMSQVLRLFLIVGFLGSFTTFSSFAFDGGVLYEKGEYFKMLLYIVFSVFLGFASFFLALYVTKIFLR